MFQFLQIIPQFYPDRKNISEWQDPRLIIRFILFNYRN